MNRPYLNLGCGREILPRERRPEYALVPEAVFHYPLWHNVDRNAAPGVDQVIDLFTYPWPLESNSYDGALLCHIAEHIPHEIRYSGYPKSRDRFDSPGITPRWVEKWYDAWGAEQSWRDMYQSGWFAFWSELYRVLTPGAQVYILSPYGKSDDQLSDPTHTRPITERVLQHSMQPNPDAPFAYETGGINFAVNQITYGVMPRYAALMPLASDPPDVAAAKQVQFSHALETNWNVVNNIFCQLECVK